MRPGSFRRALTPQLESLDRLTAMPRPLDAAVTTAPSGRSESPRHQTDRLHCAPVPPSDVTHEPRRHGGLDPARVTEVMCGSHVRRITRDGTDRKQAESPAARRPRGESRNARCVAGRAQLSPKVAGLPCQRAWRRHRVRVDDDMFRSVGCKDYAGAWCAPQGGASCPGGPNLVSCERSSLTF